MGTSSMDSSGTSPVSGKTGTIGVLSGEDSGDCELCEDGVDIPSRADMNSNWSIGWEQEGAHAGRDGDG